MLNFDIDHIYSLYNADDGVVLFDCIDEAESVKRRWEEVVPVAGPFQHVRLEKALIPAMQRALTTITEIAKENPALAKQRQLGALALELQSALGSLTNPTQSS